MRLIVLFSLKPGIGHEAYREWALAHDLPTVRGLPSIAARFATIADATFLTTEPL